MKIILTQDELQNHQIIKYEFKNLEQFVPSEPKKPSELQKSNVFPKIESMEKKDDSLNDLKVNKVLHEMQQKNESFSESLLKKIDELSTSLVKMEMNFEKQQEEFSKRLISEREKALKEGMEQGKEQMQKEIALEIDAQKKQIIESIQKMNITADSFDKVTKNLEKELVDAAIDIAKEVLSSEIKENSSKIAYNLAKNLIDDVKGAMKIKIKANPQDCAYLKENITANSAIEIIPDGAISKGGIIIESDAGNVDGTVMMRFNAIKKTILEH